MVYALFINTVYRSHKSLYLEKNIKNKTYGIIHIFKNYFVILFSVFNFSKKVIQTNK